MEGRMRRSPTTVREMPTEATTPSLSLHYPCTTHHDGDTTPDPMGNIPRSQEQQSPHVTGLTS